MILEPIAGWEQLPPGWSHPDVSGVAVDQRDIVLLFVRGEHPVIVYDATGRFLTAWGEGVFASPHSIRVAVNGDVWCVDNGDHTVRRFTPDGALLLTLGTPGVPSDTGAVFDEGGDFYLDQVRRAGPFNAPTDVAVLSTGDVYVTDGYANAAVHRFRDDGEYLGSWGEPGSGLGELRIPHAIVAAPDEELLYVADRENSRIQRFTRDGELVDAWSGITRPTGMAFMQDGYLLVAELGERVGRWDWMPAVDNRTVPSRCSVLDNQGRVVERLGTADSDTPGSFFAAHAIAVDSHGDVYVGEVARTAGALSDEPVRERRSFQKLRPVDHS